MSQYLQKFLIIFLKAFIFLGEFFESPVDFGYPGTVDREIDLGGSEIQSLKC